MRKIVRLTESDLTRIVRRVIKEQNEMSPKIGDFKKIRFNKTPSRIYEKNGFVTLNWNHPKEPGNNNISVTYREGDAKFDIIVVDKTKKTTACEKIKGIINELISKGGDGQFRINNETCGGQIFFNIDKFNSIPEMVNSVYDKLF